MVACKQSLRRAATALLLLTGLAACEPLTSLQIPNPVTCNGENASSAAAERMVTVVDSATKCLLWFGAVFANSDAAAIQCAEDEIGDNASQFDVDVGEVRQYCLAAIDGQYCTTFEYLSTSGSNASVCVTNQYPAGNIRDVTSDTQTNGYFDASKCANWCANHGF